MEEIYKNVKDSTPGKIYGNVKTHKTGNPKIATTSGCKSTLENLLYDTAGELPSRIKDTNHILDIIDNLNFLDLRFTINSILVSFDIINMFPNIDNNLGLSFVKKYLDLCSKNIRTNCLLEALELCLTCNNSIFNNDNYLQIGDTVLRTCYLHITYYILSQEKYKQHSTWYSTTTETNFRFR